uniref:DUF223 domain-containing protein n=1 Tax=Rhabditophanes sp. KR3021 TaxID=114890 RepID=A0AC35U4Y8_9BILA
MGVSVDKRKDGLVSIKKMSVGEFKEFRNLDKNCGLVIRKYEKHLTFKWNCTSDLERFAEKYRTSLTGKWVGGLNGIILGTIKTEVKSKSIIVEDQNVFHCDFIFYYIVFSPKVNKCYDCVITKVDKKYVLGKLFNIIPCMIKNTANQTITEDSMVRLTYVRSEFKGRLSMIVGNFKEVLMLAKVKKENNVTTFESDDEDEKLADEIKTVEIIDIDLNE